MTRFLPFALAALFVLPACDSAGSTDVETQVVVSGFLGAGEPLANVTLTRTVPLGDLYDPTTAGIRDAAVRVELLGAGGAVEQTFAYVSSGDGTGTYTPVPGTSDTAVPGRTYRLVAGALGTTVTAETTVPAAFRATVPLTREIVYQSNATGPTVTITTSSVAGRQSVYIATTEALAADRFDPFERDGKTFYRSRNEAGRFRPVPIVAELAADCEEVAGRLECEEDPFADFRSGSSPIINEANYRLLGDGTAAVDVPWLAFGFYGPNAVSLVALDDAYQDFIETQTLQQNPTTISPGEIPNVTTNVRGGLGVFGSFARVTARTTILER